MATKTASVTGNWSNTATWGGAAIPADGDTIVINANVTVEYDIPTVAIAVGTGGSLTATGVCAASVLTDAAKGWTVNAYVGYALYVLGVAYPITANTATTITVTGTLPTGTWSYDIHVYGATGLGSITTTSHATTPGKLTFTQTTGRHWLPIKTGTNILGTNLAAHGEVLIGTSGTPISTAFLGIYRLGSGYIQTTYSRQRWYCSAPTNEYAKLTGAQTFPAAGSSVTFNLDRDLSADTLWAVQGTDVWVTVINFKTGQGELRRGIVTAVGASTITVLSPPGASSQAMAAGSYVCLMYRPVTYYVTSGNSQSAFQGGNNVNNNDDGYVSNCSIIFGDVQYQTAGGLANNALLGTVNHFTFAGKCVFGQIWSLSTAAIPVQFSGLMLGGSSIAYAGGMGRFESDFLSLGLNGQNCSSNCIFNGTILHAGTGIGYFADGLIFNGTVQGCTNGIVRQNGQTLLRQSVIGGTGTGIANTQDFASGMYCGPVIGYGTRQRSSTAYGAGAWCTTVAEVGTKHDPSKAILIFYDNAIDDGAGGNLPQIGQLKAWFLAGIAYSEAAPASPPVTLAFAHRMEHQGTIYPAVIDIPITLEGGTPLDLTFYVKLNSAAYSWTSGPAFQLIDPHYPYGHASSVVATATTSVGGAVDTASSAWQTVYLRYTPGIPATSSFPIGAKKNYFIRATGWVSSASGNPYWHWNYTQNAVVNANVQYIEGDDDVAGWMAAATRGVMVVP